MKRGNRRLLALLVGLVIGWGIRVHGQGGSANQNNYPAQLNQANSWPQPQNFAGGISGYGNGLGLQAFNTTTTCTTAATISTPCTTSAISLPTSYSDTNYRVNLTGLGVTAFPQIQTITKSNSSFTITLNNLTAAAATYSSFDVIVTHN